MIKKQQTKIKAKISLDFKLKTRSSPFVLKTALKRITAKKFFKTDDGKTVSYQPSFPIKPAIYSCVLTESVLQIKPTNQSKRCMIKEIIKPASYPCVPVLSPLAALME